VCVVVCPDSAIVCVYRAQEWDDNYMQIKCSQLVQL
jgi:Fe-S-cluster-containing hydrogenase component 2